MTFPAMVSGITAHNEWPVQRNYRGGPFEASDLLLAFAPEYPPTDPHHRAYYSADNGHTWAEADRENAPVGASPSSLLRHASVSQDGDAFYYYAPSGATGCDIHVFDAATKTWGTTLAGPAVTWGTTAITETAVWGFYRPASSDHVIVCQVPTETVGTPFRRCALYYGTPGAWTGPLYLSTGTSSLPGTAVHHDLMYAITGVSGRIHLFWTEATTTLGQLNSRVITASNTFGTTVNMVSAVSLPALLVAQFPLGSGTAYEDAGTKIAILSGTGTLGNVTAYVLRVDSLTSDTAGNWSKTLVSSAGGETATSSPGALLSVGGKLLFLLRVRDNQTLDWTMDGGADDWQPLADWKPDVLTTIYGICGSSLSDRAGFIYRNNSTGFLTYDCIHVYQSKASKGAGIYTTEHDCGAGGISDYLILKDTSAGAGISSVIEVRMRNDEGCAWGDPLITLGTEESDSRDEAHTGQTDRYVQITEIVTGTLESGVAGF